MTLIIQWFCRYHCHLHDSISRRIAIAITLPFCRSKSRAFLCVSEQEGAHVNSQYDGVVSESDADNVVNVGESVRFTMVVRNTGAA